MNMQPNFDDFAGIFSPEEIAEIKNIAAGLFSDLTVTKWDDHSFIPGFSADSSKFAYNDWNMRSGDVLVASYPKTGTTWTSEVVEHILFSDEELKLSSQLLPQFKEIDIGPREKFALTDKLPFKRRLFRTHLPGNLVNVEKLTQTGVKIVCPIRNPKDQMVSFYNFIPKLPPGMVEPMKTMFSSGWENYFQYAINGDIPVFSRPGEWYPDHILSWYKHHDNKNVRFIYFEDMKKDFLKEIKNLSNFIDAPLTEERAKKIADVCTFDNMKKAKQAEESMLANMMSVGMRKGGVGDWKNYFTVNQSDEVDAIMKEKLKDTNIKFTYEL